MSTIGDRIREVRESLGWTQERLAMEAKISKGFLSDVENNKRSISAENVLKIANALGASLEYLMRGETSDYEKKREPVQIPPELSEAAEKFGWSYSETLTLLETHKSIIARRSKKSLKPLAVEGWKELHSLIKEMYP
ncbi:MAG: helix-turn-helix domain-containing protein [Candidatus Tectomicrobia bacterium]|nr:helix-turn-helix domain-containing protein [Candidatus Tectomicrobia bacterium]